MTLSIMENHDAIKTALKDYQTNTGEIPKVLERYLEYVARTGKPLFSWDLISCLVMKKFENVLDDFVQDKPVQCIKNANSDNLSVQDLKQECILALNNLTGVPFTIQRLCELLLSPKKNYSKLEKFLRGFLRVIKVVTTVDRIGQKITTESQLFANAMSPFHVNESGDNWSGFSTQTDESISKIQFHNHEEINSLNDNKHDSLEYPVDEKLARSGNPCITTDTMTSYPGSLKSVVVLVEQHQSAVMTASAVSSCSSSIATCQPETISQQQQYFMDQTNQKPTISMPPIGALFKPIDQLEAFVQTVSNHQPQQQVDSSTPIASTSCHEQQQHVASGGETTTYSPSKKRPIATLDESVITSEDQSPPSLQSDCSSVDNEDMNTSFESTAIGRTGLSSPAKKRRLDRSQNQAQEAVISSSCASSTAAAAIATAATLVVLVEDAAMMVSTGELEMTCGELRDDDIGEQAGPSTECCSEEPSSSTNELVNTVTNGDEVPAHEQKVCFLTGVTPSTVHLRDAASNSQGSHTVVEAADQSNCAVDEEESGELGLSQAMTEPEAASSIDEETGEHV